MLTDTNTLAKVDAASTGTAYGDDQGRRKRSARDLKVTAEATAKRMAWVVQIHAVRDTKDRAAFAELFGYFAPRV